jgi:hypothetical protein
MISIIPDAFYCRIKTPKFLRRIDLRVSPFGGTACCGSKWFDVACERPTKMAGDV